ncbi:Hint domain-containing protein [Nannocystis pusilla]|uniref:Intein C-terminal splicing domain-containing protein n=1 Tax=Nannocystis pusilla TaxID=889268 RepID=A0ABS7TP40_9BACT|nr:Hint domain-containing protein [Nannocystis pusilla]MBZ5709931.1 hypothetical protein [Nannocystis pusilla]
MHTPRGEVPVGALGVGDRVWSIDVATGRRIEATVLQVRRATRECMALHWRDGALICTPDHPVYAPETGDYRPAGGWTPARGLLLATDEGVRTVAVTAIEVYAGLHEVVDLTLDVEPHNFVAAGVVVHNKSPAPDFLEAEEDGPDIELGAGEEVAYRVRACLDGTDGDLWVTAQVEARTLVVPTDNVPFSLGITVETVHGSTTGTAAVPFDDKVDYELGNNKECSEGVLFNFHRADEGEGGEIGVTWSVRAAIDRTEHTVAEDATISITIEPEP